MNFKIRQEILIKHLNYVIKGISNKNVTSILNCIKFDLCEEGLYLSSTDNDIAIKTFIDKNEIEKNYICGKFVVFGKYIYEIIKELPNEIINIEEVIDSKIFIYTENSSFSLNCNNINNFPDIDLEDSENPVILSTKIFKNIFNQTAFAASTQETRPEITGINFKIIKNKLECTATDSYRIAKKVIELDKNMYDINIIIPYKILSLLNQILNDDEKIIEIHIFKEIIIFKFDNTIFKSNLIKKLFPNLDLFITNKFLLKLIINKDEFYSLLKCASVFSLEEEANTIKLKCNDNDIIITSNIPGVGNMEKYMKVEKSCFENITINFSSKYMMDAIEKFDCDEIELCFNGELKPIIIKNTNDNNLIYLIVPIKTY